MQKRTIGAIAILVLFILFGIYIFSKRPAVSPVTNSLLPMNDATIPSDVKIETLNPGTGPTVQAGNRVRVHYTGTLTDGTVFDSSIGRGQPFTFTLGAGEVIQGWDIGVAGMQVGEKRRLTIPPAFAYGAAQIGPIPPNSTLIFEVELVAIE